MTPDDPHEMTVNALQTRVQELEADLARLSSRLTMLDAILDESPSVIYLKHADGRYIFVNQQYCQLFNLPEEQIIGKTDYELWPPEAAEVFRDNDRAVIEANVPIESEEQADSPQGWRYYLSAKFPISTSEGVFVAGISTDISERKALEQRQIELQNQVIQIQETALAELSTPLIPISETILVMPLVGTVDSKRAGQMMERLLIGVSEQRGVKTVIIDITGVLVVDTQVADLFVRATQAVHLLGVDVKLTGIRPEVAQTLVSLGIHLNISTYNSLQQAIAASL